MRSVYWRIVLEPVADREAAISIAGQIAEMIPGSKVETFESYYKFHDSWSFYIACGIDDIPFQEAIQLIRSLSNGIAGPSTETLHEEDETFEMIFNRTQFSEFGKESLFPIRWMHANLDG